MLTCISCSKHQQEEDDTATTPSTKQAIKALTSHIKDMALKASGAYKQCKPCSGSTNESSYKRTVSPSSNSTMAASVSGRSEAVVFMNESDEWVAQVEPGVLITLVSLAQGGNDLKRIRFSREVFNKWQAQRWWAENYDKVLELYNVQRFNRQAVPMQTPTRSEDESSKVPSIEDSPVTPPLSKECLPRNFHRPTGMGYSSSDSLDHHPRHYSESGGLASTPKVSSISRAKTSIDTSVRTSSSRECDHSGELSISNASDLETEWVEQDEPGVYITIRALPGGSRELRRVRFSREKFGEMHARQWWEQNRARIQQQYL